MTTDPDRPAVPGLEPADGRSRPAEPDTQRFHVEEHPRVVEPAPRTSRRLGAADDPDRFDPERVAAAAARPPDLPPDLPRGLDPRHDPDRFVPPGQGQTLTELLGKEGSQEGDRDGYQWVAGLIGVFLFLALVAFLFNSVLTP